MPMPMMPEMDSSQVAGPMPGQMPQGPVPGGPTGPGPGGDLASLLGMGAAPQSTGVDPMQMGLNQFDILAQIIVDIARTFPGSEQMATQMMELLEMWKQQVLVMATPQSSAMPGADQMM